VSGLELDDIQGNVLQGYRLHHAAYVGLQIADPAAARRWLRTVLDDVTDARRMPDGAKPADALNIAFSFEGLRVLDVDWPLAEVSPEFAQGMAARYTEVHDRGKSAPSTWEPELQPGRIHVLVAVHASSPTRRSLRVASLLAGMRRHGLSPDHPQLASVGHRRAREAFGFRDGFGQPAIAGFDHSYQPGRGVPVRRRYRRNPGWRAVKPGEFILGYVNEDNTIDTEHPCLRNGTFMVFRKLAQNVPAFRALVTQLAAEHFDGNEDLAGAKIVGRWPDGTPLVSSPERNHKHIARDPARINDFSYGGDARGYRCPLGAHIRRANPRDAMFGGGDRTRRHRIIRRGMPYRHALPTGGVEEGLFFVCFNASIVRQFEAVNGWLRNGDAFGVPGGDLLTSPKGNPVMRVEADPPIEFRTHTNGEPLVRTRGGEYLFLPGKHALWALVRS
jgi:Dyp-type peroxidase family